MRILIISAVAPPEPLVTGLINWDIGNYMSQKGHEVWLVSSYPSRPVGSTYIEQNAERVTKISENFRHVRVRSFTCPEYKLLGRFYESFDFGLKSIKYVNRNFRNYDLIYVSSWAFLGQLMILLLRRNRKAPLVMNIQDLYPESFFIKLRSKALIRLLKPLYSIDRFIARRSEYLTVVSKTLKEVYLNSRKIPGNKVFVLYNWQDEAEFTKPAAPKSDVIVRRGIPDVAGKFIFMYLGNIGPVADVQTVIEAFSSLKNQDSILIIAGTGTCRQECIQLAENKGLTSIRFLNVERGLSAVAEIQNIADVLLLPVVSGGANSSVPSKLIAYMFSAKPIITSANSISETAEAVQKAKCGWVTASHTPDEWLATMKEAYITEREDMRKMGQAGFNYALQNYSKKNGLLRAEELFERVAKDGNVT
jgi:glycosyltransferase involved in cell wall biosynthesis